jgi:hypothetical protein
MSDNSFERILQEVHNQKDRLEALLAENAALRQQLADLRAGRGIFVEIVDKRFALVGDTILAAENAPTSPISFMNDQVADNLTIFEDAPNSSLLETLLPTTDEFEYTEPENAQAGSDESDENSLEPVGNAPFLEEMLVDEFAAASTQSMPAPKRSETRKLAQIDENEKEVLRKELVGSFLLE